MHAFGSGVSSNWIRFVYPDNSPKRPKIFAWEATSLYFCFHKVWSPNRGFPSMDGELAACRLHYLGWVGHRDLVSMANDGFRDEWNLGGVVTFFGMIFFHVIYAYPKPKLLIDGSKKCTYLQACWKWMKSTRTSRLGNIDRHILRSRGTLGAIGCWQFHGWSLLQEAPKKT